MEINQKDQLSLIDNTLQLINENQGDTKILEHALNLARTIFNILSTLDEDQNSVGFYLQEYAYNSLEASKGDEGAKAWLDENRHSLDQAFTTKYPNTK